MKTVKKLVPVLWLALFLWTLCVARTSYAQPKQCEGPPELCAQIIELQGKLEVQKAVSDKKDVEKSKVQLEEEKKDAENVARMLALAAVMAILLKSLVSALQAWKGFFTTDKQKAWLKVITLVIGFVAFLLSNIGFGIPWWQSVILAGGGPGAILVHELMKLIPVLLGKKKLDEVEKKSDAADGGKEETSRGE